MLTVTSAARDRIRSLLAPFPQPATARIVRPDGRLKLRHGKARSGDEVIQDDGQNMLFRGVPIARQLDDRVLGIRETASGPKLRFRAPG